MPISKRTQQVLKRLRSEISRTVFEGLRSGKDAAEVANIDVKRYLVENFGPRLQQQIWNEFNETVEAARLEAQEKYTWIKERTLVYPVDEINPVLQNALEAVSVQQDKIEDGIVRALDEMLKTNKSFAQIEGRVLQFVNGRISVAATIANTAISGFSNISRIGFATQAGVDRFVYRGPIAQRKFCADRLGKVYTLDEIRSMSNGHGLEVLHYCGGYNCRHFWDSFVDAELIKKAG